MTAVRLALLVVVTLLAACGGASSPPPVTPEVDPVLGEPPTSDADAEALIGKMLTRIDEVGGCPASNRVWCIASQGWAKGEAGALPASPFLVTGVSVAFLEASGDDDLMTGLVSFSALGVNPATQKALIADVPATNPAEQRAVAQGIDATVAVLKHQAEMADLPASLVGYTRKFVTEARYPITRDGKDWRFRGEASARVRKVGDAWVAIEIPKEGPRGILVSIYTPRFRAVP
jgi:hypothetical protein